ncbi:MAG: hypothetical protein LBG92_11370 [Prevotellaceae bacterium]|jgi:hypothetical protein|nr:hypothetical protein [Prevotellaceae bacterium]
MMIRICYYTAYCAIFCAASILFSSCSEHIAVNDVDALNLRFRVKTINESFYIAQNSFNNIILRKKIYEYKYLFDYDCRSKLLQKEIFINNSPAAACDSACSDSVKNRFPFAMKEPDYSLVRFSYSDTATVSEWYDRNENMFMYSIQTNINNRPDSEEVFSASNDLISKTKFWYDSRNRPVNKTVFYQTGYSETLYEYSTSEKTETDSEFTYIYRYRLDGRVAGKKTYRGIAPVSETLYFYNRFGDAVLEKETFNNGEVRKTACEYTYDSKNNWILCVEYNHSGNIFVRTRTITYY